jgi:hypothetical protein
MAPCFMWTAENTCRVTEARGWIAHSTSSPVKWKRTELHPRSAILHKNFETTDSARFWAGILRLHFLFVNPFWFKCSKLLLEQEARKTLHVDLHIGVAHTSAVSSKILKIDKNDKNRTKSVNLSEHKLSYESLQHCEISTLELGILIGHEYNRVNCLVDGPGKPKASTRTIQIERLKRRISI